MSGNLPRSSEHQQAPSTPPDPLPKPATTLDHRAYPHLFDAVLSHLSPQHRACFRLNRALTEQITPKMYEHVWIESARNTTAAHANFFFPNSERVRVPGLGLGMSADTTFARLARYTRAVDIDLGEGRERPSSELVGSLRNVAVLRRLDTGLVGPAEHPAKAWVASSWLPRPTAEELWQLCEATTISLPTEVSFFHCSSVGSTRPYTRYTRQIARFQASKAVSSLRNMTSSSERSISVFYLDLACSGYCILPTQYVITRAQTQVLVFLPGPQGGVSHTAGCGLTSAYLGMLYPILLSLAATSALETNIVIGPMEFLDNGVLNLHSLDNDLVGAERNAEILRRINTLFARVPWVDEFVGHISLLGLEEMKGVVGHAVWDWVTVSLAALRPAMSG